MTYWTCKAGKHTFVMDVEITAPNDITGRGSNMIGWTIETGMNKKRNLPQCERFRVYVEEGKKDLHETVTASLPIENWKLFNPSTKEQ